MLKENFAPVDKGEMLAKLAALPIQRWNYRGDGATHVGPTAEDFSATFGLGASAPFDILNSGPGFFGGGILNELAGDILQGFEGHGLIQFIGTFTSISFNVPFAEFWHGFQIGVPGAVPAPEPATLALLVLGLAGLGLARRRRG